MEQSTKDNKPNVLVIEDDKGTQLLYQKVFPSDWFTVYFADDGEIGLELYEKHRPDLIILDMMLPVLTGYVVLKAIRAKDTSTNIFIATSLSSKSDIIECSKLGIQGFIVKPFNFKDLRKKFAAYSPLADLINAEDQHKKSAPIATPSKSSDKKTIPHYCSALLAGEMSPLDVSKIIMEIAKAEKLDLPSMPDIVFKIQEAMADENASFKDLAKIISNDQNISSKLIGLANSAFYGGSRKSNTIEEAILRVGVGEAKEIVFILSNRGMYALQDARFEGELSKLSDHSMACGAASKIIAEHLQFDDPFFLFTLGVLHDLGKLVLIRILSDSFKGEEEFDMQTIQEVISKLHTIIGAMVIKNMEFPSTFEQIVLKHDKPSQDFDQLAKELPVVVMGNLLANKFGYAASEPHEIDVSETKAYKYTKMNQEVMGSVEKGLGKYFEMMGALQ